MTFKRNSYTGPVNSGVVHIHHIAGVLMRSSPHPFSPNRLHRPLLAFAMATTLAVTTASAVNAQTESSPTEAPTSSTPAEQQPAPEATSEQEAKVEVPLEHPVSVADAMEVADDVSVRELQYNVEGAGGGVIVQPGATAEEVQSELDKATAPHGFHPPIDTVIVAVTAEDDSSANGQQADLQAVTPDAQESRDVTDTVTQQLDDKPEAAMQGVPEQPILGTEPAESDSPSASGPTRRYADASKYPWTPTYANSTAWEIEPGIATFQHDVVWSNSGGFISDIKPEFGFEIGEKQYNFSLPGGARPACDLNPGADDGAFWAQRQGGGQGAPLTWGVLIENNSSSDYKPYWDYDNDSDGCDQMEFPIGIGHPQKMRRSEGAFTHLFTEIRTLRGGTRSSRVQSDMQTPQDNCAPLPRSSGCMGLNTQTTDGDLNILGLDNGFTVPGSWHTDWNNPEGKGDPLYNNDRCAPYGSIGANYSMLNKAAGPLGRCMTWPYPAANGGEAENFANGRSYWHPLVANGNANAVWGRIGQRYLELGAEAGGLKYPTSNELACPNRGSCFFNRFETGNIYWSPTTNAQSVWGAIFLEYGRQGYENGRFGLPTTSEFDTPDGKQVNFERGWIRWIRSTGAIVTS